MRNRYYEDGWIDTDRTVLNKLLFFAPTALRSGTLTLGVKTTRNLVKYRKLNTLVAFSRHVGGVNRDIRHVCLAYFFGVFYDGT